MRPRTAVRVNTLEKCRPGVYLIDLPPFQVETFELGWDDPPGGSDSEPTVIPSSRWRRITGGG